MELSYGWGVEPFAPTALSWEGGLWGRIPLSYFARPMADWPASPLWRPLPPPLPRPAPLLCLGHRNQLRKPHLQLARSFRLPHPVELWANGFHEGARRYEIGNPTLPTEIAYTLQSRFAHRPLTFQNYLHVLPAVCLL